MNEIWKDIIGCEGSYQVSNLGRVKSLARRIFNYKGSFISKEKILKPCLDSKGYLMVNIHCNGKRKSRNVHQLVAESFLNHKQCGLKLVVNHKDFITTNNRLDNLEIVTQRTNANLKHIPHSSKYTGVLFDKRLNCWISSIKHNGKSIHLGRFKIEEEASLCYEKAKLEIESGKEITLKRRIKSSIYKFVTWHKASNKWQAYMYVDKKQISLGFFTTELDAANAYQQAKERIKNNQSC